MRTTEQQQRFKRAYVCSFGAALPLLLWACWTPIPFQFLKIAQLAACAWLWFGTYYLIPRARQALALASVAVLLVLLWPAPQTVISPQSYARALEMYRGVPYVWGGENGRGLDCSGLMRRAMQDALWREGLRKRNPSLWRAAIGLWWRDASAQAMKEGDGGRVRAMFAARDLASIDLNQVQIGDMAVTRSGVHVLAYLGNGNWIQADPNLANGGDKVIVCHAPTRNGWFHQPVVICRWVWLVR